MSNEQNFLGVGPAQPQSGIDYPFARPSTAAGSGAFFGSLFDEFRDLVFDMSLVLDTDETAHSPSFYSAPFRLAGFGMSDGVLYAEIADSTGKICFNYTPTQVGAMAATSGNWGPDRTFYVLRIERSYLYILVDNSVWDFLGGVQWINADLDSRVVTIVPQRINRLAFRVGAKDPDVLPEETELITLQQAGAATGDEPFEKTQVVFKNEYNMEITATTTTRESGTVQSLITFNAVPAGGKGKFNNCTQTGTPISKINGEATEDGKALIAAKDCLAVAAPVTFEYTEDLILDGTWDPTNKNYSVASTKKDPALYGNLVFGADCQPCCECQDYIDVAEKIAIYQSQYSLIGQRAHTVKELHESNIDRFATANECNAENPLRIDAIIQRCPYVDIIGRVCNANEACLENNELKITIAPKIPPEFFEISIDRLRSLGEENANLEHPWVYLYKATPDTLIPEIDGRGWKHTRIWLPDPDTGGLPNKDAVWSGDTFKYKEPIEDITDLPTATKAPLSDKYTYVISEWDQVNARFKIVREIVIEEDVTRTSIDPVTGEEETIVIGVRKNLEYANAGPADFLPPLTQEELNDPDFPTSEANQYSVAMLEDILADLQPGYQVEYSNSVNGGRQIVDQLNWANMDWHASKGRNAFLVEFPVIYKQDTAYVKFRVKFARTTAFPFQIHAEFTSKGGAGSRVAADSITGNLLEEGLVDRSYVPPNSAQTQRQGLHKSIGSGMLYIKSTKPPPPAILADSGAVYFNFSVLGSQTVRLMAQITDPDTQSSPQNIIAAVVGTRTTIDAEGNESTVQVNEELVQTSVLLHTADKIIIEFEAPALYASGQYSIDYTVQGICGLSKSGTINNVFTVISSQQTDWGENYSGPLGDSLVAGYGGVVQNNNFYFHDWADVSVPGSVKIIQTLESHQTAALDFAGNLVASAAGPPMDCICPACCRLETGDAFSIGSFCNATETVGPCTVNSESHPDDCNEFAGNPINCTLVQEDFDLAFSPAQYIDEPSAESSSRLSLSITLLRLDGTTVTKDYFVIYDPIVPGLTLKSPLYGGKTGPTFLIMQGTEPLTLVENTETGKTQDNVRIIISRLNDKENETDPDTFTDVYSHDTGLDASGVPTDDRFRILEVDTEDGPVQYVIFLDNEAQALDAGTYRVTGRVENTAGATFDTVFGTFTVTTTAPDAPIITDADGVTKEPTEYKTYRTNRKRLNTNFTLADGAESNFVRVTVMQITTGAIFTYTNYAQDSVIPGTPWLFKMAAEDAPGEDGLYIVAISNLAYDEDKNVVAGTRGALVELRTRAPAAPYMPEEVGDGIHLYLPEFGKDYKLSIDLEAASLQWDICSDVSDARPGAIFLHPTTVPIIFFYAGNDTADSSSIGVRILPGFEQRWNFRDLVVGAGATATVEATLEDPFGNTITVDAPFRKNSLEPTIINNAGAWLKADDGSNAAENYWCQTPNSPTVHIVADIKIAYTDPEMQSYYLQPILIPVTQATDRNGWNTAESYIKETWAGSSPAQSNNFTPGGTYTATRADADPNIPSTAEPWLSEPYGAGWPERLNEYAFNAGPDNLKAMTYAPTAMSESEEDGLYYLELRLWKAVPAQPVLELTLNCDGTTKRSTFV